MYFNNLTLYVVENGKKLHTIDFSSHIFKQGTSCTYSPWLLLLDSYTWQAYDMIQVWCSSYAHVWFCSWGSFHVSLLLKLCIGLAWLGHNIRECYTGVVLCYFWWYSHVRCDLFASQADCWLPRLWLSFLVVPSLLPHRATSGLLLVFLIQVFNCISCQDSYLCTTLLASPGWG